MEHGRGAQLCALRSTALPCRTSFPTRALLKNRHWLKKIPIMDFFFFLRKLEKDPKSSEVTALLSPLGSCLPASSPADLGNHHVHCHKSSHLFLPPKASVTHKTQPPRGCAHAARALPGVNDCTHPQNSCSWHPSPLLQALGTGSSQLPAHQTPRQLPFATTFSLLLPTPPMDTAPAVPANKAGLTTQSRKTTPREQGRKAL